MLITEIAYTDNKIEEFKKREEVGKFSSLLILKRTI